MNVTECIRPYGRREVIPVTVSPVVEVQAKYCAERGAIFTAEDSGSTGVFTCCEFEGEDLHLEISFGKQANHHAALCKTVTRAYALVAQREESDFARYVARAERESLELSANLYREVDAENP